MTQGSSATRRVLFLLAGVALIAIAILLVATFTGNDESDEPFSPIAEAAERTARIPGAKLSLSATMELPGAAGGLQIEGRGAYNGKTDHSQITTVVEGGPMGTFTMTQVSEGLVTYMRSSMFATGLPDGKSWMKIDLSDFAADGGLGAGTDPKEQFKQLEAVSDDARRLGNERVRGVQAVHYAATVDLGRQVEQLREDGGDEAADALEAILETTGETASPVEVWIDRKGYLRRMVTEVPLPAATGSGASMKIRQDLYDFGVEPKISIPPDDAVFDATEAARAPFEELTE